MSSPTSNRNPKTIILDVATKIRENRNYGEKFGLSVNVAQHIDSRLIIYDIHIDNLIIALNVEHNLWILNCCKSYQVRQTLVVNFMLEVFCKEFYR